MCIIICLFSALELLGTEAVALDFDMSSTSNPVGSGARATGMGGAFIGVADDATAASWNPAGLVQLEKPEVSAVYAHFQRIQKYDSSLHPEIAGEDSVDTDSLNYASAAYPFVLFNRNMIVSLNYQRLYELDKTIKGKVLIPIEDSDPDLETDASLKYERTVDGHLYAIAPAMAIQVAPGLYLGATLNIWDNIAGRNGWENKKKFTTTTNINMSVEEPDVFSFNMRTHDVSTQHITQDVSFQGINQNVGFLWEITDSLTLGGVYKTPFDADLNIKVKETNINECTSTSTTTMFDVSESETVDCSTPQESKPGERLDHTLRMPSAYGIGLSYRYSDRFTVALDVYRTEWSRFMIIDEEENEINPLTGDCINVSNEEDFINCPLEKRSNDRLKDTTQVRMGTEYLFIRNKYVIPVRFGVFYDPEPATDHVDDFYGFSLGTGVSYGNIALDTSYQFRMGNDATGDLQEIEESEVDIKQHVWMLSLIVYLGS
ncbi:MAG: outer membrane protein transport protein [Nitrospirae bacterium]|nr:outer membrane protein transport protein [Nitrospirota bacterium]